MNLFIFTVIICIFIYYIIHNKKERFENSEETIPKVYISFTTIPSRIAYIDEMLRSVDIPEVYEIHLNLQSEFEYPEKEIERLKSITPKLKVFWSTGKYIIMSKSIPTLERLLGTNALVLVVDDDMEYSREIIKTFINNYNPNVNELIGGYWYNENPIKHNETTIRYCKTDIILVGAYGILYPMKIVTEDIIKDMKKSGKLSKICYSAEDTATCVIFSKYGIRSRMIEPNLENKIKSLNYSVIDAYHLRTFAPEDENLEKYRSTEYYNKIKCCEAIHTFL